MDRRRWKRVVIISGASVLGLALFLPWMVMRGFKEVLSNDEVASLATDVSMLGGRVHVGLYRQHMWDAMLWYVTAYSGSLPHQIRAPNGVVDSTMQIITRPAQLGFDHPPYELTQVSQTALRLCEGEGACRSIRCDPASLGCRLDGN